MTSGGSDHPNHYYDGVVHHGLGSLGDMTLNNSGTSIATPTNSTTNQPSSGLYNHYHDSSGIQPSPSFLPANNAISSEFNAPNHYFPQQLQSDSGSLSQSNHSKSQQSSIHPPPPQSQSQSSQYQQHHLSQQPQSENHNYNHMNQSSHQRNIITPYLNSQLQSLNTNNDEFDYFSYEGSMSVPSSKIDHPYYQELNFNLNDIDLTSSVQPSVNLQHHPHEPHFQQPQFHFDAQPAVDQRSNNQNPSHFQAPHQHHIQQEQFHPLRQLPQQQEPPFPYHQSLQQHQLLQQQAPVHTYIQHTQDLFQDANIKRKLSSTQLHQEALIPPPKSKSTKPPTIRQNSMPVVSTTGKKVNSKASTKLSTSITANAQDVFADTELWDSYMANNSEIPLFNEKVELSTSNQSTKSSTIKTTTQSLQAKNPRGRPRKGKNNPGFYLKLDSVRSDLLYNKGHEISSSQSDSGIYNFENLKNVTPTNQLFNFNDDSRISEQDLNDLQKLPSNKSIVTPSHKPPTNGNSYFELESFNTIPDDNGNLISPRIHYNESSFDSFNQSFEQYLDTPKDLNTVQLPSGEISSASPYNQTLLKVRKETSAPPALVAPSTVPSSFDSHVSGLKDTPNSGMSHTASESSHKNLMDSYEAEESDNEDDDVVSSNEEDEEDDEVKDDEENDQFLSLGDIRPSVDRTGSSQSVSSAESTTSNRDDGTKRDKTKKKKTPKGAVCPVCKKFISRDLTRHMRIHNAVGRFQCVYPKLMCKHKTQYFNRPYDYKKHLLHMHFKFDDPKGKTANTLTDKLPLQGTCLACGVRLIANDWLDGHVLTSQSQHRCPFVENKDPGS